MIEAQIERVSKVEYGRWQLKREYYVGLFDCLKDISNIYAELADSAAEGNSDNFKTKMVEVDHSMNNLTDFEMRGMYLLPLELIQFISLVRQHMVEAGESSSDISALREISGKCSRGMESIAFFIRKDLFNEQIEMNAFLKVLYP